MGIVRQWWYVVAGFLVLLSVPQSVSAASHWQDNATVTIVNGKVKGREDAFETWVWKALPYARPPVGELRWQAPLDPEPWSDVLEETAFCNMCPQYATGLFDNGSSQITVGDEDCLYLNIWRPRSGATTLPVYFWIHGGSNKQGSADPYDSSVIAGTENMVVVTINYRLGPLGWFTHPAFRDGTDEANSSGNFALLDIIKALEWVRDNIEAFGGDPGNVTISGQSAGGVNVFSLMISPLASGLFHRAVSMSGQLQPDAMSDGDAYADSVIEALLVANGTPEEQAATARKNMTNKEIRDFMRAQNAEELYSAIQELDGNPDIFADGAVIHADGPDALDDPANYNQVPIIIGSTSEEAKLFMFMAGLHKTWGNVLYQGFAKQGTRAARSIGMDSLADKMGSHARQPGVYSYIFTYGQYRAFGYNAWPTSKGPTFTKSWALALGSFHALDIPFHFGLIGSFSLFNLDELLFREDNRAGYEALSDAMISYTAQFARTGDPNTEGLPQWAGWSTENGAKKFLLFDADDDGYVIEMAEDVP